MMHYNFIYGDLIDDLDLFEISMNEIIDCQEKATETQKELNHLHYQYLEDEKRKKFYGE